MQQGLTTTVQEENIICSKMQPDRITHEHVINYKAIISLRLLERKYNFIKQLFSFQRATRHSYSADMVSRNF